MRRIGIVGGGPGGLMTAYILGKITSEPISITIYEASDRLGGKIRTKKFSNYEMIYEAGAAEIYDYSDVGEDPLKELIVDELGLPIRMMSGSAVILNHLLLENLDDLEEHFGTEARNGLVEFHRKAKDKISPEEFYRSDEIQGSIIPNLEDKFQSLLQEINNPITQNYIKYLIHSDLATEPTKTSVSYGLQNYLMNDPNYMKLYSIEGGNERLIYELTNRINAKYYLKQPVRKIHKKNEYCYQIISNKEERQYEDEFDFVVIALPNSYLPEIEYTDRRLSLAISDHYHFYNYPAHYLRITILFDRPFWREKMTESWCMLDQFDGCCLYDESSRIPDAEYGVLGWLIGGEAAEKLSHLSDQDLIQKSLESLPNFMKAGRKYFVEGHVHRWINAVNGIPGGIIPQPLSRRHQPEPKENPHVFVVGDYLYDSTLNGVYDSADYVAHWISSLILSHFERM